MSYELTQEIAQLRRQRNVFAGGLFLMVVSNALLSIKLSNADERLVMIPGINQEMRIEGAKVSESYLEEASLLYLSALLDLTPSTVKAKEEVILRHVSPKSPENMIKMKKYFADIVDQHTKFQLFTFFTLEKMEIIPEKLEVIASGLLSSTFGKRGSETKEVTYILNFDLVGGLLKLKQFKKLK